MSRLPSSKRCQLAPKSVLTSLPESPTAIAVWPSTQVTPERYSEGADGERLQLRPASKVRAKLSGDAVGAAKSPPTAIPRCCPLKARPLIPAVGPNSMGVGATVQVTPRSSERKTRAAAPPLPNHARWPWSVVRHSPLAAKAASPGAAGICRPVMCQLIPPSFVAITRK